MNPAPNADFMLHLATSAGANVLPGSRGLDFGCGLGDTVRYLLARGVDAWGVDVKEWWGSNFAEYWESRELPNDEAVKRLRVVGHPYHLPFEDYTFDFIISNQVFEHVMDYEAAFREIKRVLRADGVSVHLFPSPWRPIESHVNVPLAGVIQSPIWLKLWALLGRRNDFHRVTNWRDVAEANHEYLRLETNYVRPSEIRRLGEKVGLNVSFDPSAYVRHHPGRAGKLVRALPRPLPRLAALLFAVASHRVMILRH